jgi:hypothetical protein
VDNAGCRFGDLLSLSQHKRLWSNYFFSTDFNSLVRMHPLLKSDVFRQSLFVKELFPPISK